MRLERLANRRRFRVVAAGIAVVAGILAVLGLAGNPDRAGAALDPKPSPLFKNSLEKSVRQVSTPFGERGQAELAAVPHPDQQNRWPIGGVTAKAAGSGPLIEVAFVADMDLFIVPGEFAPGACGDPMPVQVSGPVVVQMPPPPYANGDPIPIEIIGMNLVGVSPIGPVEVRERLGQPSVSQLQNVVTDPNGDILQCDSFFDIFIEIEFPTQPIPAGFFGPGSLPFEGSVSGPFPNLGQPHPTPPSLPPGPLVDSETGEPIGTVCGGVITPRETADGDTLCWCIYELVCASGPPDVLAGLGLCVGDKRRGNMCTGPDCQTGTCVTPVTQTDGSVCLEWRIAPEYCAPSNLPPMPNIPRLPCTCDPSAPTMPSSPSCPGDISCPEGATCGTTPSCPPYPSCPTGETCPESPSCGGTETCPGTASCPETPSCPGVSSCRGESTCPWTPSCEGNLSCSGTYTCGTNYTCEGPSCPSYASCGGTASCPGTNTCNGTPSCPAALTCPNSSTCPGFWSCTGTPTCAGAVSCANTPPLDPYSVVFSVAGGHNAAEGIQQGIFGFAPPEPNDVFSLGPGHGYLTEGELFQASGVSGAVGVDMTNVDRLSSSLGVGPAPMGGPPYIGPFDPTPFAPLPAPAPPGALGTFGLLSGDNINALSFGRDGGSILLFSVNTLAIGKPGTAVFFEANVSPASGAPISPFPPSNGGGDPGDEAAGDIFRSGLFARFGTGGGPVLNPTTVGSNALEIDEVFLGLQAPAVAWSLNLGIGEDDLDALETEDAFTIDPDGDGIPNPGSHAYFSLDFASVQVVNGIPDPFPGVATGFDPDGVTANDILITPVPGGGPVFRYAIYARGVMDIGLLPGDDLDALVLDDADPVGVLSPGDEILFSLAGGSPSLTAGANPNMPAGALSPGDVYRKQFGIPGIRRYARATDLGLLDSDELNALDIGACIDTCGADSDGDGVNDLCDNCPNHFNPGQLDTDGDGVGDVCDNCPTVFNPDQADSNGNGIGDACEPGVCLCPFQGDMNADGSINATDLTLIINVIFFSGPDPQDPTCPTTRADFNGNGIVNAVDLTLAINYIFFGGPPPVNPCTCPGGFPCP